MSIVLAVLSIILQTAGVVFLFAATLGLLRFKDALQRMHASTKAGTIGAGLVLAGTVLTMDSAEGIAIGVLAILFLLLTVPVAGHLLGRAAYISGVDLVGLEGRDALHGVLHRSHKPLDCDLSFKGERADTRVTSASVTPAPPLGGVRLAITAPHEETLARRALSIARGNGVPVEAKAIIDTKMIETFASADRGLDTIKAQLADAVAAVQALCAKEDTKLSLFYTEGEVNKLIPDGLRNDLLLVLPLT